MREGVPRENGGGGGGFGCVRMLHIDLSEEGVPHYLMEAV